MAAESSGDESEAAEEEERLNNFRDFVIYNTMVGRLCIDHDNGEEEEDEDDDNRPMLLIPDSEYARVMLQNIDSFCQLLASITYLHWVHSSSPAKVGINEGNVASWNKLFSALGGLEYIDNLQIQGTNFSPEIVVRTIQAAQSLGVGAPDTTMCVLQMSSVKDLVPLVEAVHVSALGCEHIHLEFLGKLRPGDDEGIMFQLIRDYHWMSLRLYRIDFTHDESKALGRMLSTDCVSTNCFSIVDCTFQDGGDELVSRELGANTSLKSIILNGSLQDDSFRNEFLHSFPLNTSAESLSFSNTTNIPVNTALDLLKSIAHRNCTLKQLGFNSPYPLSNMQQEELNDAVSQNYNLERVFLGTHEQNYAETFDAILQLNKAGRRYLAEDGTSRSKCIAVLAKVKNNLDCLYYHMREKHILCMGYTCSSEETTAGKKRRQSDR